MSPPSCTSLLFSSPSQPSRLSQSRAPALGFLGHTANSHWVSILAMVMCMFHLPGGAGGKENLPAKAGDIRDMGLIPGSGRSPGKGNGNPVQYSCLENSMGRGAWWDVVHAMAKSWTWLCHYLSLFFFRLKNIFNETRDSIKIMLICTLKSLASLILLQS